MIKIGLIGIAALSLALASPAVAGDPKPVKRQARVVAPDPYAEPSLPIENALRWGYSQGYSNYPSGYGGLYGDGRYPGNTISNKNYPTWW